MEDLSEKKLRKKELNAHLDSIELTLHLREPGLPTITQKRLLWGSLAQNRTPLYTTDIVVAPGPISAEASAFMLLEAMVANTPAIANVFGHEGGLKAAARRQLHYHPSLLYDWLVSRQTIAQAFSRNRSRVKLVGGPSVVMQTSQITSNPTSGTVGIRNSLDVVIDRMRYIPAEESAYDEAFESNIRIGAAKTQLEFFLLSEIHKDNPPKNPLLINKKKSAKRNRQAGWLHVSRVSIHLLLTSNTWALSERSLRSVKSAVTCTT